jgi:hypothetical protein
MSTLAIDLPRRRFTEIDFLLVAIWAAFAVAIAAHPSNPFMVYAAIGGAVLVAAHFLQLFSLGQASGINLTIAAAMPFFMLISAAGLRWVTRLSGASAYDALLAHTDFGIAVAVMNWAQARLWVIEPLRLAYAALPMAMMFGVAFAQKEQQGQLVRAALLGSVLVLPCYLIFPAVGPAHVGQIGVAPNCMPSLHLTWALLIWTYSSGWKRWAAAVFVALTAAATLATGEHYVVDLVAAVPFTWMLTRLARSGVWARFREGFLPSGVRPAR